MEAGYKYDAIFFGGGSSGRFGGTFLKMLGGKRR
jgi:hypothetical protein